MKTITIGRGDGADIIIDDEMISRRHAILKIYASGKMEIVDMGKNGTYVNGIKLRPNVPFVVTRKDVVNFAEVTQLDWSQIPDNMKYFKLGGLAVIALILLIALGSTIKSCQKEVINNETPVKVEGKKAEAPVNPETEVQNESKEEVKEKATESKEDAAKGARQKTLEQYFPHPKKKKKDDKDEKKDKDKEKGNPSESSTIIM